MLFITYNDSPDGIYHSQVIDVCRFLENPLGKKVELVAFVSGRTYFKDRKAIKKDFPQSTVFPLFPGIQNWRKNRFSLNLLMMFRKPQEAITRGVFATLLALGNKKITSVTFDARGAYSAEWKEYMSGESPEVVREIAVLEKEALFGSDFRIAVSTQLVQYWKTEYGFTGKDYVIIPSTLNSYSKAIQPQKELRKEWRVKDTDVLLVFSGSTARWQSMERLYSILNEAFSENNSLKLLLLSKDRSNADFLGLFPGRIITTWVKPDMVPAYLNAADYGLLYRENTVTNGVSSPVKFAQYLNAGLPVIISDNVGDYSKFTIENKCGLLFGSLDWKILKRPAPEERLRMTRIACDFFSKETYAGSYKKITVAHRKKP